MTKPTENNIDLNSDTENINPTPFGVKEVIHHPCKETCSGWKQGYESGMKRAADICEMHVMPRLFDSARSALRAIQKELEENK